MWLRSIFLKTLRDYGLAIAGWGIGIGALVPIIFAGVSSLTHSPDAQTELLAIVQNPIFRLFGEPVDVLHAGGYATWRLSFILPLLGVWALLAASRTLRGEEEDGSLDVLLSVPRSRTRLGVEKIAAIGAALVLMALIIGLLAFVGGRTTDVALSPGAALLFGLNVSLLASVFGAAALLTSQLTRERRPAAGISGALLGLSLLLTASGRTIPNGEWIAWLSPVYYFELSKPLIPGYGAKPGAMMALAVVSASLSALAVALFIRRDVGAPFPLPFTDWLSTTRREQVNVTARDAWSLRSVFARNLRTLTAPTLWWGSVLASYAALLVFLIHQVQRNIAGMLEGLSKGNPVYAEMIARFVGGENVEANVALLNGIFTLLVTVPAVFAITLANRWAADEEDGRLELLLATPHSRQWVILARFTAASISLLLVAALLFLATALAADRAGMKLETNRLAQGAFGMVPAALVVLAAGYLLAGWLRAATVTGVLIAFLLASFLLVILGPLFHLPPVLMQLSIFEHYGMPLVEGLRLRPTLGMVGVAAAALSIAGVRFSRKDIGV